MARAVANKDNGKWWVTVDVDTYGGEQMGILRAKEFHKQIGAAIAEAERERRNDSSQPFYR